MHRKANVLFLVLLVLPSPALAIIFFSQLDRTTNTLASLFYNLFMGIFASLVSSGLFVGVVFLFRDKIRRTLEEVLGYDNTPADLVDSVARSIKLAIALSTFSTKVQRLITQAVTKQLADQARDLDTQARELNNALGIAFERAKQRIDHKKALAEAFSRKEVGN